MKAVKILFVTLSVLLVLVLLAALGVALVLDPLVQRVATDQSSKALGVPVQITDADASLTGSLALEGFVAANPAGFNEPRSIRFDRVSAKARMGSLFGDVLEIDELVVERPELTIEFLGTKSNFGSLMSRLSERKPHERADAESRKFRIRRLRVEGATVRFRADALSGNIREFTLPTIELANLGTSGDAATTSEVLAAVLQTLTAEALKAAREYLPAALLNLLGGDIDAAAKRFGGAVEDAAERVRNLPGLMREKVEDRVEDELEKGLDRLRDKLPKP